MVTTNRCPVCDAKMQGAPRQTNPDYFAFDCVTCGRFELQGSVISSLRHWRTTNAHLDRVLSHAIRRQQIGRNRLVRFDVPQIEALAANTTVPTLAEQAENLVRWVGDLSVNSPAEPKSLDGEMTRSIIGARDVGEFMFVGEHLINEGLFDSRRSGVWAGGVTATLSFEGRKRYESLKRERNPSSGAPTSIGWPRVDRSLDKMRTTLQAAKSTEDFQQVGLLGRETLISLAQEVYDTRRHSSADGLEPSSTDAARMLEAYIAVEVPGRSSTEARGCARASLKLALSLQHDRTATAREAALCYESTASVVRSIAIVSGRLDHGGLVARSSG